MVTEIQVEAVFEDGSRLAVVSDPFGVGGPGDLAPGAVLPGPAAAGPEPVLLLTVRNTAPVPISVTSHFHFFEVNPRLSFDRAAAYGMRLAVPAGASARFDAGRAVEVGLVRWRERGRRSAPPVSSTATSTPPEPRRRPCAGPPPVGTWVPPRHTGPAGVPFTSADFVGEGGAVEQDGAGTLMATRSSLLNRNRNPGMSEQTLTAEMCEAYGASKVIWFDGVYGQDITDDHVDATSRFLAPGEALVQMPLATDNDAYAKDARQQHRILTGSTTAGGVRWT